MRRQGTQRDPLLLPRVGGYPKETVIGREKWVRQFCGSVSPVAMPSFAEGYCTRIAIAFDHNSTQSSV